MESALWLPQIPQQPFPIPPNSPLGQELLRLPQLQNHPQTLLPVPRPRLQARKEFTLCWSQPADLLISFILSPVWAQGKGRQGKNAGQQVDSFPRSGPTALGHHSHVLLGQDDGVDIVCVHHAQDAAAEDP